MSRPVRDALIAGTDVHTQKFCRCVGVRTNQSPARCFHRQGSQRQDFAACEYDDSLLRRLDAKLVRRCRANIGLAELVIWHAHVQQAQAKDRAHDAAKGRIDSRLWDQPLCHGSPEVAAEEVGVAAVCIGTAGHRGGNSADVGG